MRKQVIRNLVRESAAFNVLALQDIAALLIHFLRSLDAGTAYGLIGGSVERFNRGQAVDGVDCHQRDDGGAVWIGDDTLMGERILRVDFRNHKWNLRIHTEGTGIIDVSRTGRLDGIHKSLGNIIFGGTQHDIHSLKSRILRFLNGDAAVFLRLDYFSGTAAAGQKAQLLNREIPFLQHL